MDLLLLIALPAVLAGFFGVGAWWNARVPRIEEDGWHTGCLACGASEVRTLAPGVFRCALCGYEGGPGMAEHRWQQRVEQWALLSGSERRQRVRQLCVDARRVLVSADAEVEQAATAHVSGRNNRDQNTELAESLLGSALQDFAEVRSWLEEARHLQESAGRIEVQEDYGDPGLSARISDARDQAGRLWGLLRRLDPTEGKRTFAENLALVQDEAALPVARADAFSAALRDERLTRAQWASLALAGLKAPVQVSRLALNRLAEARVDISDALAAQVREAPDAAQAQVLAEALGHQPERAAVEQALCTLLARPEYEVRLAAAKAAEWVGGDALVPLLRPLAERADSLGEAARAALVRLLGDNVALMGAVMLTAPDEQGALSLATQPPEPDA